MLENSLTLLLCDCSTLESTSLTHSKNKCPSLEVSIKAIRCDKTTLVAIDAVIKIPKTSCSYEVLEEESEK